MGGPTEVLVRTVPKLMTQTMPLPTRGVHVRAHGDASQPHRRERLARKRRPLLGGWAWRRSAGLLAGSGFYVLALVVGSGTAVVGAPFDRVEQILPAVGVAALWLSGHVERPCWWRHGDTRVAAAIIVLTPLALTFHDGRGGTVGLMEGLMRGGVVLTQAIVSVLAARRWARPGGARGDVGELWRLGLACLAGAVAAAPFGVFEVSRHVVASGGPLVATGAESSVEWLLRGSAAAFCALGLRRALRTEPSGLLQPARRLTTLGLGLATVVTCLAVAPANPRLYLFLPVALWAATTLTVRGVAMHTSALLAVATWLERPGAAQESLGAGAAWDHGLTLNSFAVVVVGVSLAVVYERQERARLVTRIREQTDVAGDHAELLESVLPSAQDALATTGPTGRLLLANAAAERIAQRTGLSLAALLALVPQGAEVGPVRAVLAGSGTTAADLQFTAATGGPGMVVAVRAYPMPQDDATGAVVSLRDVTEERLRTEGLRYFARAGQASILDSQDRAGALLRGISEFTLASDGELARQSLYLDDFVRSIAAERAADPAADPIDLRIDADVCVDTDPALLGRLVENLLGNAAKYRAGRAPARVDIVAYDSGDGEVVVSVQDRGIGVPEGQEGLIFEAFHRVPEHASRFAGSGLGLATCRQAVQRHGGTITAQRRLGGGTTFRFTLPLPTRGPVALWPDGGRVTSPATGCSGTARGTARSRAR